ncbi:MAG: MBL fold metallo-hydrolase [bacterium]
MKNRKILLIIIGLIAANLFFLIFIILQKPIKDGVEVIFLDVGQGDASLIRAEGGVNVLIDGGPDNKVVEKIDKYLPLWNRKIDIMVLTHPHSDHVSGLINVLEKYPVNEVWMTGVLHNSPEYIEFLETMKNKKTEVKIAGGENGGLGEYEIALNTKIKILYPKENLLKQKVDNLNNSSIVLKLEYKNKSFLFAGDIEKEAEDELCGQPSSNFPSSDALPATSSGGVLKADILKVAHHGSDTGSTEEFLNLVKPEIAIISVGRDNEFGLPSLRIIKRLERMGVRIIRTDEYGDVIMKVDGGDLNIN